MHPCVLGNLLRRLTGRPDPYTPRCEITSPVTRQSASGEAAGRSCGNFVNSVCPAWVYVRGHETPPKSRDRPRHPPAIQTSIKHQAASSIDRASCFHCTCTERASRKVNLALDLRPYAFSGHPEAPGYLVDYPARCRCNGSTTPGRLMMQPDA